MTGQGHIELDRAVNAIQIGERARQDLGDLTGLIESIKTHGLLQPITISPDGILLCGARRLAAVKALGMRTINVWVRSGVSTDLQRLVAEHDENTIREPLLPTEAATLYVELKKLLAEDAARRQRATQFGFELSKVPGVAGAANFAAPSRGDSRVQAARLVTGSNAYTTLERVAQVQAIAADATLPEDVRLLAREALVLFNGYVKVHGRYQDVIAATTRARQELADLAQTAIDTATKGTPTEPAGEVVERGPRLLGVRAFMLTWSELAGWTANYDPTVIGPALTEVQWDGFTRTFHETLAFLDAARTARTSAATALAMASRAS